MERTEKTPDFIKGDKEFFIEDLLFPVHVKYVFNRTFGKDPKPALDGRPLATSSFHVTQNSHHLRELVIKAIISLYTCYLNIAR
jgi:hypothetical protein